MVPEEGHRELVTLDEPEEGNEQDVQDLQGEGENEDMTCILLSLAEWKSLTNGSNNKIIRSFRVAAGSNICVLIRDSNGHEASGYITVSSVSQDKVFSKGHIEIYGRSALDRMNNQWKEVWQWMITEIDVFDSPHIVRFLDLAPRFKNRTFKCTKRQLSQCSSDAYPTEFCLKQTGRFFIDQMPDQIRNGLARTIGVLDKKVIRIGTTCSGTDIIVTVLRQTVAMLNELQAHAQLTKEHTWH